MTDRSCLQDAVRRSRLRDTWDEAHDFDPADPLVGLDRHDMGGPVLKRRTVLRLLAASGALTAAHLMPGVGTMPVRAAAGGTLRAGWSAVGEFRTIDPAQIN